MEKKIKVILNREEEYISVESDIEDKVDYLEAEEIAAIIITLLDYIIAKINKDVEDNSIDEIDNERLIRISNKKNEEVANFVGSLLLDMINFIHNRDFIISGQKEKIESCSYSLAIYSTTQDNKNKEVYETYHYGKVNENEKILGCFAFFKDIVDHLLECNNSKGKVKEILKKASAISLYNIYNYIDKY